MSIHSSVPNLFFQMAKIARSGRVWTPPEMQAIFYFGYEQCGRVPSCVRPQRSRVRDGFVLDVLVQSRRNARAAKRLMRKLLKGQGSAPRVMITDRLRSYDAARRDIMPGVEHRSHKG